MTINTIYGCFFKFIRLYDYMLEHAINTVDIELSIKGNPMCLRYSAVKRDDIKKIVDKGGLLQPSFLMWKN